jgi:amino acid adenylation domain-containing protein
MLSTSDPTPITAAPLTFGQEQWWVRERLVPGHMQINIAFPVLLYGRLDRAALERAWNELFKRHEVLRTRYDMKSLDAVQIVEPFEPQSLHFVDLQGFPRSERWSEAERWTACEESTRFDLTRAPMMRSRLLQLAPDEHLWLRTVHHIAADGWSLRILLHEIASLYNAFVDDAPSPLPPLELQQCKLAQRQREAGGERARKNLEWWIQDLKGASLELKMLSQRHQEFTQRGDQELNYGHVRFDFEVSPALHERLVTIATKEGATIFMLLSAAWALLLARCSEQEEIVIGTAFSHRMRPDERAAVGFQVQTLPLRHNVTGDITFRDLLTRTRTLTLQGFAHADFSLLDLARVLRPARNISHEPHFPVLIDSVPHRGQDSLRNLEHHRWPVSFTGEMRSLMLQIKPPFGSSPAANHFAGLELNVQCSAAFLDAAQIEQLGVRMLQLLESIAANPDEKIARLNFVGPSERAQIEDWSCGPKNPTPEYSPTDATRAARVDTMVSHQAARTPHAVALESESGEPLLNFEQLSTRAAALARKLREHGAVSGERGALLHARDKSRDFQNLYLSLLAILKAGAACVPLDAGLPVARLNAIFCDAAPRVLLAQRALSPLLENTGAASAHTIFLDEIQASGHPASTPAGLHSQPAQHGDENLPDGELIYLLYTSGSTGTPKGVAMPHRVLSNLVRWQVAQSREYSGHAPRTLQFAPLSFDVAWQEIFSTWAAGGTLVSICDATRRDPSALLEVLAARRIERVFLPFVALQQVASAASKVADAQLPRDLKEIISAGEALIVTPEIRALLQRLQQYSPTTLHNQYGPTETHVVSSHVLSGAPQEWADRVPIGRPIPNTQLWVVNDQDELAPIGLPGEIVIGGVALAQSYWNDAALTDEKFVAAARGRIYRSGDRARWNDDGQLEWLERDDGQIKVRGFRVEIGEIESVLMQHPTVESAAVVANQGASTRAQALTDSSRTQLTAFVVARAEETYHEQSHDTDSVLKAWLRARLPEYMVPSRFLHLASLPLTPSGKLDRKQLQDAAARPQRMAPTRATSTPANVGATKPDDFEEGQL